MCNLFFARFCLGSNKVLRVALGHDEADEYRQNLARLSERISGSVGLFFTSLPHDEVEPPPCKRIDNMWWYAPLGCMHACHIAQLA